MTEYPRMDETGHNPDVLVSALVHNRAKDKFLVAKRIGTLGKGASPKAVKSPTPSLSSPHLLYPPDSRSALTTLPLHPDSHNTGCFETPGGPLEYGEDFPPCATRCVRRETGLEVNARSVVALTGDVWGGVSNEKHFVTIFVLCDLKDDVDEIQVRFPLLPPTSLSLSWLLAACEDWRGFRGDRGSR